MQGILVTNNKVIFVKYLKGWFSIDLVTSMPMSLIEGAFQQSTNPLLKSKATYIKLLRLLRLPRLHRLVEVAKIGKYFRTITKNFFLLKVQDFF